jgi:hypothetical protein
VRACSGVSDFLELYNKFGAVCIYGVPLFSKKRFVGALFMGSTVAEALAPDRYACDLPITRVYLALMCRVKTSFYIKIRPS